MKRSGQTLTDDAAIREMVAKAMNERVFRRTESGKWVDRLVKGNRNLALRLYDWAADQVQAFYLRIRNKNGEGREAANAFKRMRELQRQFETVLDDAGVEYEKRSTIEVVPDITPDTAQTQYSLVGISEDGKKMAHCKMNLQ